jgi:protein ImuB
MFACLYVPPLAGGPAPNHRLPAVSGRQEMERGPVGQAWPAPRAGSPDAPWDVARASRGDLASLAREFSPRVEVHGPGLVTLDACGLERLFGGARNLGEELRRATAARGLPARIAIASTRTAAWLLVHARCGLTAVPAAEERAALAPLPLHVLEQLARNGLGPSHGTLGQGSAKSAPVSLTPDPRPRIHNPGARQPQRRFRTADSEQIVIMLSVLKRWGIRTLGEFASLPARALSERLGQQGLAWQHLARGEEMAPLVPDGPEERFEETLDLEWPIEGLQPLSFVFGRLFDALSARLVERDRAAAVLHIHLRLVTREVEHRTLQMPAPMREGRVLRTLALLHLESHPVEAGIDSVTVVAEPVPGRILQASLLSRALPVPEQMATLLARLGAVMGERNCGMAALVDSHRPGAFAMNPFPVVARQAQHEARSASVRLAPDPWPRILNPGPRRTRHVLRRFRIPVPASVAVQDGRPARVATSRHGLRCGKVEACAGPWRTSGEWWHVSEARVQVDSTGLPRPGTEVGWNRDEWDVNLADGGAYRIYRDRDRDRWFIDAVID